MAIKLFNTEEEAYAFLGITLIENPDLSWVQPQNHKAIVATNKLFNIHEAHNKANKFIADWANGNQSKYNAWHWIKRDEEQASGFGFSLTDCGRWRATTNVGSRLSLGTSKEAIHIAKTFDYLYQDLYFFF
ncbi:MAG TPA: hypothetical protein VGM41_08275 [Chitinophagaceae bacterium]